MGGRATSGFCVWRVVGLCGLVLVLGLVGTICRFLLCFFFVASASTEISTLSLLGLFSTLRRSRAARGRRGYCGRRLACPGLFVLDVGLFWTRCRSLLD